MLDWATSTIICDFRGGEKYLKLIEAVWYKLPMQQIIVAGIDFEFLCIAMPLLLSSKLKISRL